MKGVIFNSIAEAVVELGGEDLWDEILHKGAIEGSYTSLGSYDDAQLFALVVILAEVFERTVEDTIEYLGELIYPHLSGRHTDLIAKHRGTISLLCELNDVIHPEVLKLYPEASVPDFTTLRRDGNELDLLYRSDRNLPWLAAGLIRGAAKSYGEEVSIGIESTDDGHILHLVFQQAHIPSLALGP